MYKNQDSPIQDECNKVLKDNFVIQEAETISNACLGYLPIVSDNQYYLFRNTLSWACLL